MRKHIYACSALLFCAIVTAGCAHVPDLTEEQNNQIAEYMAASLLKYDENYDAVLEYDESVLEITPTPVPTPTPEPEQTQTPQEGTEPEQGTVTGDGTETAATPVVLSKDLSSVFGSDEYVVTADSAELVGRRYEDIYNTTVEAAEGKQLMVVTFKIKNTGSSSAKLDMTSKERKKNPIKFTASVGGNTITPLSTIVSNDLQYYKGEIPAGKSRSAVLLFEVDKDTDVSELTVAASNEDTQAAMALE